VRERECVCGRDRESERDENRVDLKGKRRECGRKGYIVREGWRELYNEGE